MKKKLLIVLALSLITVTGCSTGGNVNSRLDSLEQRVAALEGNSTVESTSSKEKKNTSQQSTDSDNSEGLDVLSFELVTADPNGTSSKVKHTYKVTNNGTKPIEYMSIKVAYYDAEGNAIDTDGRFKDIVVEPQKSVNIDSYGGEESTKGNIASSKVTSYDYYLVNPDANGNNKFEVNCETGKVKASYTER